MKSKIPPARFKLIEFELYNYDNTKEEIEAIKDEIIGSPPLPIGEQDNIQRSTVSDPTFSKTAVLCSNVTLQYMERTIKAIDRALLQLDEIHNEIFEHRYQKHKNWRQTLSDLCIGQDTYFKKRRELILSVAMQLGFTDPF